MKKLTLLFSLLFLFQNITSQNFWAYTAGGIKEDEAMDICHDNSGNIISAGYFSGTTTFAPGYTLNPVSLGNPDIYISKSNSAGQIIWAQKAGGNGSDRATSVKSDASGNIYITGYYYGTAAFGSTILTSISGSQDGFIAKLDVSGNFVWAKSFGGNLAEWGNAIAIDELDNLVITGQFQGSANFNGTVLTSMMNPNTLFYSFDVFTAKYSPAGNLIWVNQGSAKFDDRGMDVITDNLNNIYVCGQISDTVRFQNTHNNMIMNATFIIKYNAAGQEQWFRKASGVFSIPYSMVIDNANKIYVAGDFQGSFTYFGTNTNSTINGIYANKAFLMKIDDNGNFIWGKSESSTSYVSAKRVSLDAQQDPYIFGEFNCTMNEYSDAYGPGIFNSVGFGDLFITKYDNSGIRQWFKHYGGPRNDKAHGLLVAGINEPVMAGSYEHHLNIPVTNGSLLEINSIYNSVGNNFNQPSTYCSAPNNYSNYSGIYCRGYSDAFIFKGMDLTRNPYDYYDRTGASCNLNYMGICIEDRYDLLQCPDTIPICFKDSIAVNEHADAVNGNYGYDNIGPIFRYKWNNNFNDTLRQLLITTSGYNQVKVTTLDGCYSSMDTVYVKVNPLPAPPTITDNLGINVQHLPWANNIHVCGPATFTLTGGNIHGNSFQWEGNTLSTPDSSAIVNSSGYYYFIVTNVYGCTDTNRILIQLDPSVPTFVPKQKNDTIAICFNKKDKHIICDSITNPALNYQYPCVDHQGVYIVSQSAGLFISPVNYNCDLSFLVGANATGNYTYTAAYIINNLCVHDTIYFTGHIYITVKPSPNASVILNGNNLLCPGDTSLLVGTIGNFSSPNITYTFSPNDSLLVYTEGYHNINVYLQDTVSGCSDYIYADKYVTVKPNPFIILNPYNSIICPNDSVKLTINLPGAINYEWHGPTGLLSVNSQSFYSQIAGFYHCIVTDNNGCVFTTNTVEIKQYATPYLLSSPTNIICNNQPLNLHVNTLDSSLIVWNTPLFGGGATKVITSPAVYSCQVTMCGITTSLSINIIGSNPVSNISASATTVCPFDSVLLTGNIGMTNYIWQPGNHLGQTYFVHSDGTYTLEVTDIYGCTAKSTPVTIAFSSTVTPPIAIVNDTICAGQTATLSATSSGNQLDWFPNTNSGSIINTGLTYVTPTLSTQTTYYVASVNTAGCHSSGVPATVFMYSTSLSPLLIADTTVCKHDSLKIVSPYINGASYNWSGPGITTNTTNLIAIGNTDSTYAGVYSLHVSGFGCSAPSSSITIYVLNPSSPTISGIDSICENSNYSAFVNPVQSNYQYEWQGPNNYSNVADSLNIVNANINQSGTYTISSNLFGCLSSVSLLQLTILEIPATPVISSNIPCEGDTLFLNVPSGSNYMYTWFNQNGNVGTGSSIVIPSADTSNNGYYGVIASNFFCNSNFNYDTIVVIPNPSMIVTSDTIACDNSSVTLICSSNYQNYSWNTGATNPSISVSQTGTYWVSSQNGNCSKTDSIHVTMVNCGSFDVNVFTPNGDGSNDVFMFRSPAIKEIHCTITNRWGEQVGKFDDPENGWTGKSMSNGKECVAGTYFYSADIKTIEGISKTIRGFLTLIR